MEEPIHKFFGLSYANYYVVPRSVLQSMPIEWQKRFVAMVNELDDCTDWVDDDFEYHVVTTKAIERNGDDELEFSVTKHFKCDFNGEDEEMKIEVVEDQYAEYRYARVSLKKIPDKTKIYYFGCIGIPGHYIFDDTPKNYGFDCPISAHQIDAKLAPDGIKEHQGKANFHEFLGHHLISFWDRSVDKRVKSNSSFIIEGNYPFSMCLEYAKEKFPEIFDRFDFEITLYEDFTNDN